jgi:hypothetical protein
VGVPDVAQTNQTGAARKSLGRRAARRRTARQACVALLTATGFFIVLQMVAAALGLWFPATVDPDYASRFERIQQGRIADPEHTRTVVMLGSSRTYYALRAADLDAPLSREVGGPVSVVNFGFTGAGPLTELLTWRRLQQDGVRPDLLLIEVLPPFLSSSFPIDEMSEDRMPTDRLRWQDLSLLERYGAGRKRPWLRGDFTAAAAGTLYSRRLEIVGAVAPQLLYAVKTRNPLVERLDPGPFPTVLSRQLLDQVRELAHREYAPSLKNYHLGGRGCEALRELLASCRRANVPAALVLMPEGPRFRSWYPPETWRKIEDWLEHLAGEEGVPLVNAREWIEEGDFLDSHHLLPHGADKFTARIGREYLLPLLRRQEETASLKGVLTGVVAPR